MDEIIFIIAFAYTMIQPWLPSILVTVGIWLQYWYEKIKIN